MSLSRIEVITGMSKFSSLKAALSKAGVRGMTVMQLFLDDLYDGIHTLRFHNNIDLLFWKQFHLFKLIHFILSGSFFHTASKYLHHGHIGDGKIFIYKLDNVIRVRTGDEGEKAL